MMSLARNRRTIWVSNPQGDPQPVLDAAGNETSEYRQDYTAPVQLAYNVSAATGEAVEEAFGAFTDYSRAVSTCDPDCPLRVGSHVWFGINPDGNTPHNYEVVRVADSLNSRLIALREVMA